jgi:hypothetical protein
MIALRATIAYTALSTCLKQVAWHGLVAPTAAFFCAGRGHPEPVGAGAWPGPAATRQQQPQGLNHT